MHPDAPTRCPLCANDATIEPSGSVYLIQCSSCGNYRVSAPESGGIDLPTEQLTLVRGFVRTRTERGHKAPWLRFGSEGATVDGATTMADIEAVAPRGLLAVQDALLVTLAAMAGYGAQVVLSPDRDTPLAFCDHSGELIYHLECLTSEGELINDGQHQIFTHFRLARSGWLRAERLRLGLVEKPRQVFVAMWYPDPEHDADWAACLRGAYDHGFIAGARAAGYDALRIDQKEHTNKICDEMVAEIRRSRIIVADVTGSRQNVYFEAGLALGLAKPVIWTCNERWAGSHPFHFDTRQYSHVVWDTPESLCAQLGSRIAATAPLPA